MASRTLLAPSILSADFADMTGALQTIEDSGADWVHLDVMDGNFVPEITFGVKMTRDLRAKTKLPFDVHLMTAAPERHVEAFARAGADAITFHLEAAVHCHGIVSRIQAAGCKAGLSIVPSTPAGALEAMLPFVDVVLVMTVNPGFGGQVMIESCLEKVSVFKELRARHNYHYLISVDGGVNARNMEQVKAAGADILVAGTAFFSASNKNDFVKTARKP